MESKSCFRAVVKALENSCNVKIELIGDGFVVVNNSDDSFTSMKYIIDADENGVFFPTFNVALPGQNPPDTLVNSAGKGKGAQKSIWSFFQDCGYDLIMAGESYIVAKIDGCKTLCSVDFGSDEEGNFGFYPTFVCHLFTIEEIQ